MIHKEKGGSDSPYISTHSSDEIGMTSNGGSLSVTLCPLYQPFATRPFCFIPGGEREGEIPSAKKKDGLIESIKDVIKNRNRCLHLLNSLPHLHLQDERRTR